jgi:hypothetical protein
MRELQWLVLDELFCSVLFCRISDEEDFVLLEKSGFRRSRKSPASSFVYHVVGYRQLNKSTFSSQGFHLLAESNEVVPILI